jgi:hypothetical protein
VRVDLHSTLFRLAKPSINCFNNLGRGSTTCANGRSGVVLGLIELFSTVVCCLSRISCDCSDFQGVAVHVLVESSRRSAMVLGTPDVNTAVARTRVEPGSIMQFSPFLSSSCSYVHYGLVFTMVIRMWWWCKANTVVLWISILREVSCDFSAFLSHRVLAIGLTSQASRLNCF